MTEPRGLAGGMNHSQVPRNEVLDQNPEKAQPCCIVCGTWVCRECWGYRRPYARYDQPAHRICGRCGGIDGFFLATRHTHWKANKPFFVNGYRHRVMPKIPFEVPTMSISNPWACPAGDPCPGTGCHACCPSYDPCGKPGCNNCKVEKMHVPEEADAMIETPVSDAALEAGLPIVQPPEPNECDWVTRPATLETPDEYCGLEVGEGKEFCPRHQASADRMMIAEDSPATKLVGTLAAIGEAVKKDYPYQEGDAIILGPECFAVPDEDMIAWQGEWYRKQPQPKESVKRDAAAERKYMRRDCMDWAVRLMEPKIRPDSLPSATASSTVQLAQSLYEWLIEE